MLKALAGPFRDVSFVPTGGINASNLADYLAVPNVLACGGTWLVAPRFSRRGGSTGSSPHAGGGRDRGAVRRTAKRDRAGAPSTGAADCRWISSRWRRRVQRRPRPAALLRPADRRRHRARRQRGRAAGRGPHPPGRRRHVAYIRWVPYDGVGRTVRNGLNFTERGFGVRGAVGCSDRGHTAASQMRRATSTGSTSSASSASAGSTPAASSPALSETTPDVAEEAMGGQEARHDRLLRPELPPEPVEGDRRPGAGAGGQPRAGPLRRRDDRQRGGLHRRASASRSTTADLSRWRPANFQKMIEAGRPRVPELQGRRDHPARGPQRDRQRLGRDASPTGAPARRPCATIWRSSIASAGATPSHRA